MTSIGILIVEVWLLAAMGLLLHRISPRFGLTPLLVYVATMMATLNFVELITHFVEHDPGAHGQVFVPLILALILVLYIAEGTQSTQLVLYGLTGVNIIALIALMFLMVYLDVRGQATVIGSLQTEVGLLTADWFREIVARLLTFVADIFAVVIVYQAVRNGFPVLPRWVGIGLALVAALWVDVVLFNLLAHFDTSDFALLPEDMMGRTLVGLFMWPLVAWYLVRVAPHVPGYKGDNSRPTFDILFGMFGRVVQALEHLQTESDESQLAYDQLTENMATVVWLMLLEPVSIHYLDPTFESMTGRERRDFYDDPTTILEIIHPDDRDRFTSNTTVYLLNTLEDEFRIVRPDGEVRWIRNRTCPVRNDAGAVYRLVGLAEDITERKQAEDSERALMLEQKQHEVMRGFISDAAHDLKSPLAGIKLKVELLRRIPDAEAQARHLNDLDARTDHLVSLIDDLSTLTRLNEPAPIILQPLDMYRVLHEVHQTMSLLAERKGLTLTIDVSSRVALIVQGDQEELVRALANLVANAIRYTESGVISLQVKARGEQVCVKVSDTGRGIAANTLPHIFERGFRAPVVIKAGIEGTGLGLAIVRRIVDLHAGTIDAHSIAGRGTTFTLMLPLAEVEALVD